MKVDHKIVTISNLQKAKVQYCYFLISDWFKTITVLLIVKDKKNDQSITRTPICSNGPGPVIRPVDPFPVLKVLR